MRFAGKACQPCKDSRKKCDETKPSCKRCIKSGKICHGYRPSFDVIQAENIYASGQMKRPRGARTTVQQPSDIRPTPSRDISSEAMAYYMNNYFLPTDKSDPILSARTSNPALEHAVESAALAIFSRVKDCRSLAAVECHARYQKSVSAMQCELLHVKPDNVDANLLAILFMTRYEDSVFGGSPAFTPKVFRERYVKAHHDGLCALLEYWAQNAVGNNDIAPTTAIKHARRKLRKAAMLADFELPETLRDGTVFGESDSDLELDHLLVRIIDLRRQVSQLLAMNEVSSAFLQAARHVHEQAESIVQKLNSWCASVVSDRDAQIVARTHCNGFQILVRHLQIQALERLAVLQDDPMLSELFTSRQAIISTAEALSMSISDFVYSKSTAVNYNTFTINTNALLLREMMPHRIELIVLSLVIAASTPYIDKIYADGFRSQLQQAGRACGCGLMEALAEKSLLQL